MAKAVIFDVDGVLVDSRRSNFLYMRDTVKHFGHREITEEEYHGLFHKSGRDVIRTLMPGITEDKLDEIRRYQDGMFEGYFRFARLNNGVLETLDFLRDRGIRLGVVTNRTKSARKILEFFGIEKYFKVVLGADDVTSTKPHPEPVLKAAKLLRVRPEDVMYVGDSDPDVQSANAAGAISVFYSDKKNPMAKFNISDMEELQLIV